MDTFLRAHRRVALDTSIFIYKLDPSPRYITLARRVFDWIEQSDCQAVTSTITMTELLVRPIRELNRKEVDAIQGFLTIFPNLEWIASDLEIASTAAEIRAHHNLKVADALQAATAIHASASGLIANDAVFRRVPAFETLLFDELL